MEVHGYPLKTPTLDIHTVGAGGGSIAYIDAAGSSRSARARAGAAPGPVCYGLGNDEPTVTDANVVLRNAQPGAPARRSHDDRPGARRGGDRAARPRVSAST